MSKFFKYFLNHIGFYLDFVYSCPDWHESKKYFQETKSSKSWSKTFPWCQIGCTEGSVLIPNNSDSGFCGLLAVNVNKLWLTGRWRWVEREEAGDDGDGPHQSVLSRTWSSQQPPPAWPWMRVSMKNRCWSTTGDLLWRESSYPASLCQESWVGFLKFIVPQI